jgi:hypothetical protein
MKVILRITLMIALLAAGFAAGFPMGRSNGFSTGSEWALMQAGILVREAGLFMPVNFEAGKFRIILKQPKHIYRRAWVLADRHEDEIAFMCEGDRTLNERIQLIRNAAMLQ